MFLYIVDIIIAVLLIAAILLQSQGGGISTSFGGTGEIYRSRRSAEKVLFTATVILSLIFGVFSLILLIPR